MRRWLRVVLPEEAFGVFLLVFVGEDLFFSFVQAPNKPGLALLFGAIMYGAYRVLAFHPIFRPDYSEWLKGTPWTSSLPLPIGPIALVPQDLIVVAFGAFLALRTPLISPGTIPLLMLTSYLAFLTFSLFSTGRIRMGFVLAFGLGLVIRCWWNPLVAWAVAVVLYAGGWFSLRRALAKFPWEEDRKNEPLEMRAFRGMSPEQIKQQLRARILGWPFDTLRPLDDELDWPRTRSILICLLAGWWLHVALVLIVERSGEPEAAFGIGMMASVMGVSMLAVIRIALFVKNYHPPISLWGRIFTFRWLIPGYDKIFAAPLAACVISGVCITLMGIWRFPLEAGFPVALTVALLFLSLGGPRLRTWKLTGNHRIVSGHGFAMLDQKTVGEVEKI